jgi:hypothetical protein
MQGPPRAVGERVASIPAVPGIAEVGDELERHTERISHPGHEVGRHVGERPGDGRIGLSMGLAQDVVQEQSGRIVDPELPLPPAAAGRHHRGAHRGVRSGSVRLLRLDDDDASPGLRRGECGREASGAGARYDEVGVRLGARHVRRSRAAAAAGSAPRGRSRCR